MRKIITIAALVLLVGCGQSQSYAEEAQPERVAVVVEQVGTDDELFAVRDEKRGVTCYVYKGYRRGGVDCIPDSQLQGR